MSGIRNRTLLTLGLAGFCLLGLVLIAPVASAADHVVMVRNFAFDPADLIIQVGDTVIWEWESGSHTTTNGTGGADPESGSLWNAIVSSGNPTFQLNFPDAGTFPYYCIPHELAGMVGTITVEEGTPVETITWGRIKRIFDNTRGTVGGLR